MTRLGYQIPNFTYPGVDEHRLFEVVAAQATAADRSGFDTVMVMDHFYQLPMIGKPDEFMLECYSLLSALAGCTERVRLPLVPPSEPTRVAVRQALEGLGLI